MYKRLKISGMRGKQEEESHLHLYRATSHFLLISPTPQKTHTYAVGGDLSFRF
jgi:hypothetical protein